MNDHVTTLINNIDSLKNPSRRNKLIVDKEGESEAETTNFLKEVVLTGIFKKRFWNPWASFKCIHRLGNNTCKKTRPLILWQFVLKENWIN